MTALLSATGCTFQGFVPSSPQERAEIETQVRGCFPGLRRGRWTRIESLEQWEFGFELTAEDYRDQKSAECLRRISDEIGARHSDISFGYHAPQGAQN